MVTDLLTGGRAVKWGDKITDWRAPSFGAEMSALAAMAAQQLLAWHRARTEHLGYHLWSPRTRTAWAILAHCVFKVCLYSSLSLGCRVKLIQILKSFNYILFSLLGQKLGQQPCPWKSTCLVCLLKTVIHSCPIQLTIISMALFSAFTSPGSCHTQKTRPPYQAV